MMRLQYCTQVKYNSFSVLDDWTQPLLCPGIDAPCQRAETTLSLSRCCSFVLSEKSVQWKAMATFPQYPTYTS